MLKRVAHSLGFVEHTTNNKDSKSKKGYKELSSRSKDFVVRITHAGGQQELYRHAVPAYKLMTKYPGMCVSKPEVFKLPHQSVLWRDDLLLPGHKYILISFKDVEKLKRKHPEKNQTKDPNGVVAKEEENLDTKSRSPSGHKHKENNGKMKESNGLSQLETLDGDTNRFLNGHHHKGNGKMKDSNGLALETRSEEVVEVNTKGGESLDGEVLEECFIPAKDFYIPNEKSTRSSRRRGLRAKKPFVPPLPKARHYRSFGWQPSLPSVKELSP